jgi:histidinol-phosphate aminotransferase
MKKIHLPFAVNMAALTAGSAALKDQTFVETTRQTMLQNRYWLAEQLQQHHLTYLPSYANFITIHCEQDCLEIVQNLEKRGIIVRPLHPYGMKNYIRVTIGTEEQNQRFINTLLSLIR